MILKYPLFLLFLGASLAPRVAAAQPAADASRQPRVVLLDEAAPMAPSFRDTLRELLGRLSLSLASSPGPVKVLARVRVETRPGAVAVLVARGDGSPFVLREVPAGDSIAVLSETVAHVILGAVEALVSEPEAVPPAPAPSAAPPAAPSAAPPAAPEPAPPAPAPPGSPSRGPLLALEARGLLARPDALVPGLAGRIGVGAPWALRPRLFVEGAWMSFREVRQRSIEAGVGVQALRGGLQIDAMRGARWALTSSLRVGGRSLRCHEARGAQQRAGLALGALAADGRRLDRRSLAGGPVALDRR